MPQAGHTRQSKLEKARQRLRVISSALKWLDTKERGKSTKTVTGAANWWMSRLDGHLLPPDATSALDWLGRTSISQVTIRRWLRAYLHSGIDGLIPQQTGRQRKPAPWDKKAIELHATGMQPTAISHELKRDGFVATPGQINRLLKQTSKPVQDRKAAEKRESKLLMNFRDSSKVHQDELLRTAAQLAEINRKPKGST